MPKNKKSSIKKESSNKQKIVKSRPGKIQEDEKFFKRLIENLDAMIFRIKLPEVDYEYVNPVCFNITGYTQDEFYARSKELLRQIFHPDWKEFFHKELERVIKGVVPASYEFKIIHKDGREKWVLQRNNPVFKNGKIIALEGVITDITARKEIEEKLKESEEKFSKAFKNAPVIFSISDLKTGTFIDVNDYALEISGFTRDEVIGHNSVEIKWISKEDRILLVDSLIKDKGVILGREFPFRKKDGTFIIGLLYAEKIFINDKEYLLTIILDITEKKSAEEKIKESEDLYKSAFMTSPDAVNINKLDGTFIHINDGFTRMTGFTKEDVIGAKSSAINIWAIPEDRERLIKGLMENGTIENHESVFRCKDGTLKTGLMSAKIININKEQHILSITRDINDRKKMEESIKVSEEKLRTLIENVNEVIFIHDTDGVFTYLSPQIQSFIGYDLNDFIGKKWIDITTLDHPANLKTLKSIQNCFETRSTETIINNIEIKTKDGRILFLEVTEKVLYDKDEKILGMIGSARDITERYQAEKEREAAVNALKESEEKYRNIFNNAVEGIFRSTVDGKLLQVNPAFVNITGYDSQEDMIKSIKSLKNDLFADPSDREKFAEIISKNNEVKNFEAEAYKKNKEKIWILLNARAVRDSSKNILFFDGRVMDITEKKKSEQALIENEKKYRMLFENMTDGFTLNKLVYNEKGEPHDLIAIEANPAFERITGLKVKDMLGKTLRETNPGISEERMKLYLDVAATGHPIRKDVYALDRQKYLSMMIFSPAKDQCAIIIEDIDDRIKTHQALQDSEERYRNIFNNAVEGIFQSTIEGSFIQVNPSFVKMIGYDSEEEVYKNLKNLKHDLYVNPEDRDRFLEELKKNSEARNFEVEVLKKNKEKIFISINAKAIRDKENNIQHIEGTIVDITLRKKSEDEIKRLNLELAERVHKRTEELENAIKELESFAYSVSHDLRAPLRHINSFSEMLLEESKVELEESTKKYLSMISSASKKMNDLIDNLLNFSRIGRTEITYSPIDMNRLVKESIDFNLQDNKFREIKWIVAKIKNIEGDLFLIRQAFINLISNAIKYTKNSNNPVIEIGYKEEKHEHIIFVKDNGVGFDMKYVNKLFSVFSRLHSDREYQGVGIGLALVKRIISRHNGRVWAEAETDKGATFYFSIPKERK